MATRYRMNCARSIDRRECPPSGASFISAVAQPNPQIRALPAPDLGATVDLLMARWCARKALRPLQLLLRAYPGPLWHLYHRMELLDILETVNGTCREDLAQDELCVLSGLLDVLKGGKSLRPETAVTPST